MTLNVLLIEDNLDLALTVIDYLELESIDCDHASNGVLGLQLLENHTFDVLLLDLNLPRLDGLSLCEQLRQQGDDLPVLMLTARDQLSDKLDGFEVGTDDYLIKPFELDELVARIQALAKRRSGQALILQHGELTMNLESKTVTRQDQHLKLSPTTWKLLEQLLRAAPNVISKDKLIAAVWGDDSPDTNALKVHMHHLRKSVDGPFDQPLIHTVTGHGFKLDHD